jgi:hypothetical protein
VDVEDIFDRWIPERVGHRRSLTPNRPIVFSLRLYESRKYSTVFRE